MWWGNKKQSQNRVGIQVYLTDGAVITQSQTVLQGDLNEMNNNIEKKVKDIYTALQEPGDYLIVENPAFIVLKRNVLKVIKLCQ